MEESSISSSSSDSDRTEPSLLVRQHMLATVRRRSNNCSPKLKNQQLSLSMGADLFEHTASLVATASHTAVTQEETDNIDVLSIFERARAYDRPGLAQVTSNKTASSAVDCAMPSTSAIGVHQTPSFSKEQCTSSRRHTIDPQYLYGHSCDDPRWYFNSEPEPEDPNLIRIRQKVKEIEDRQKNGPPPKPLKPEPDADLLKGVVAYVDVIRNNCKLTLPAARDVMRLGGIVRKTFAKDVTHTIFDNGSRTTYKKAQETNVKFVGLSWLFSCIDNNKRMPEDEFPPGDLERYQMGKRQKRCKLPILEQLARREKNLVKRRATLTKIQQETAKSRETDSRTSQRQGHVASSMTSQQEVTNCRTKSLEKGQKLAARPKRKSTINVTYIYKSDSDTSEISTPPSKKRKVQGEEMDVYISDVWDDYESCCNPYFYMYLSENEGNENQSSAPEHETTCEQPLETTDTCEQQMDVQNLTESVGELGLQEATCVPPEKFDRSDTTCNSSATFNKPNSDTPSSSTKGNIVLTMLSNEEMDFTDSVVQKLGKYSIVNEIDASVTHVVCGLSVYTENAMRGLIAGCWVVSLDWVVKSFDNGGWLPEMEYVPAPFLQAIKRTKSTIDPWHQHKVFQSVGKIYFMESVNEFRVYQKLVVLAGGDVTEKPVEADIIVVSRKHQLPKPHKFYMGPIFVYSSWVKASLSNLALEPFQDHKKPIKWKI